MFFQEVATEGRTAGGAAPQPKVAALIVEIMKNLGQIGEMLF